MAFALPGFNDIGRSVTPIYLFLKGKGLSKEVTQAS